MFDRSIKKNRVETTILEFWFNRHMWIIQELYIDDVIVLIMHSGATLRVKTLFFIKTILWGWFGCIEAIVLKLYMSRSKKIDLISFLFFSIYLSIFYF